MSLGFISDIHLDSNSPKKTQMFFDFLDQAKNKYSKLFILGDLFEYWIGDDDDSSVILQIKQSLYRLSQKGVGALEPLGGLQLARSTALELLRRLELALSAGIELRMHRLHLGLALQSSRLHLLARARQGAVQPPHLALHCANLHQG